jgi:fructose-1,6-bisphosphatase II
VNSDNTFFAATGVTSGELLDGIRFQGDQVLTHSLVMRSKTLTSRYIEGIHSMDRIRELSEIPLD